MRRVGKKGITTLGEAPGVILAVVLVAAIGVAGFLTLEGLGSTQGYGEAGCSPATNFSECSGNVDTVLAVNNASTGMLNIFEQLPTIGVIVGVAILLGIVLTGFAFGRSRGMF